MMRLVTIALVAALVLVSASLDTRAQSDAPPIKIGYAISRTGPFAPGAQVTQEPNYILWADQVNAAGGISVKGQKRRVELIGYDDRSEVETIVRTYEKLMVTDKVDLILPPWGSTANFAVAPLADKHGYPVLAPTALSMKLVDMKLANFFSMLPQPYVLMAAAADMLAANGVKTVAVIYMDDVFGLENIAAFEPAVGESVGQLSDKMPPANHSVMPVGGGFLAVNQDAFPADFAADVPKSVAQFMAIAQVPVASDAFGAKITAAAWSEKKSYAVVATQDRMINPDLERFMAERAKSETIELKGSHAIFLSHAKEVAALIERAAKAAN